MKTAVTVSDIEFEPETDTDVKACMSVDVATDDHDLDFSMTFPLKHQPGMVDYALEEGRSRMITLFEKALVSLREGALRRS